MPVNVRPTLSHCTITCIRQHEVECFYVLGIRVRVTVLWWNCVDLVIRLNSSAGKCASSSSVALICSHLTLSMETARKIAHSLLKQNTVSKIFKDEFLIRFTHHVSYTFSMHTHSQLLLYALCSDPCYQ